MTSCHLQSDGQTEIMNQGLDILIHAHIVPDQDNWSDVLNTLSLSCNSSHATTGFSPAYLLCGFQPVTSTIIAVSHQALIEQEY